MLLTRMSALTVFPLSCQVGFWGEEITDLSSTNSSDSSGVCRCLQSPSTFPGVVPVVFLDSLDGGHYAYSLHKETEARTSRLVSDLGIQTPV